MDRDVTTVSRKVYTFFMLLGDVGGFYSLFVSIAATILNVVNYQKQENLLVSDLYKHETQAKEPSE